MTVESQEFSAGQIVIKIRRFRKESDFGLRSRVANWPSEQGCCSPTRIDQPHQHLNRCRFSSAVGAKKPKDFALSHLKRYSVNRRHAPTPKADAEDFYKALDLNNRLGHCIHDF